MKVKITKEPDGRDSIRMFPETNEDFSQLLNLRTDYIDCKFSMGAHLDKSVEILLG